MVVIISVHEHLLASRLEYSGHDIPASNAISHLQSIVKLISLAGRNSQVILAWKYRKMTWGLDQQYPFTLLASLTIHLSSGRLEQWHSPRGWWGTWSTCCSWCPGRHSARGRRGQTHSRSSQEYQLCQTCWEKGHPFAYCWSVWGEEGNRCIILDTLPTTTLSYILP